MGGIGGGKKFNHTERYDALIRYYARRYGLDWRMIKRQAEAESSLNPYAVSPAGAKGLMQFMPHTWEWVWSEMRREGRVAANHVPNVWNAEDSIHAACRYNRWNFDRFDEIPEESERWKFTLAAYNAGRGNINKALALARKAAGAPESHAEWVASGRQPGIWHTWSVAARSMYAVTGKKADETIRYVHQITGDSGPLGGW